MSRYITADDESDILKYLKEWESGRYGKKLTWGVLNKAFGFSRQALSGNANVKSGFDDAKAKLKDATTEIDVLTEISKENRKLKKELADANKLIHEYEQKYIRWQVNATAKGISVEALNKVVDPSIKEELRKRTQED
jgi:hypothetical protein